ncbi:MAG: hypothetical protein KAG97_02235 [Victivallales bacterium]|nr:hypothetical protein [Victivallales bacterium]
MPTDIFNLDFVLFVYFYSKLKLTGNHHDDSFEATGSPPQADEFGACAALAHAAALCRFKFHIDSGSQNEIQNHFHGKAADTIKSGAGAPHSKDALRQISNVPLERASYPKTTKFYNSYF